MMCLQGGISKGVVISIRPFYLVCIEQGTPAPFMDGCGCSKNVAHTCGETDLEYHDNGGQGKDGQPHSGHSLGDFYDLGMPHTRRPCSALFASGAFLLQPLWSCHWISVVKLPSFAAGVHNQYCAHYATTVVRWKGWKRLHVIWLGPSSKTRKNRRVMEKQVNECHGSSTRIMRISREPAFDCLVV